MAPRDPFYTCNDDDDLLHRDAGDNGGASAPSPVNGDNSLSAEDSTCNNTISHDGGGDNALDGVNSLLHEGFSGNQSKATDDSFFSFENDSNWHFISSLIYAGNTSPPPQLDFQPYYAATNSLPPITTPGDWRANIPVGMKFRPTDEELIIHYLKPHILHGASRPDGPISVADIYKYEPHQLQGMGEDHGDGKRYFITSIKKIGKSKTHRFLENNKGFWKPTQAPKPIFSTTTLDGTVKVGEKTPLAFHGEDKRKTQWLMQELKLPKNDDDCSKHDEETVLAVVYYHHRNMKRNRDGDEKYED